MLGYSVCWRPTPPLEEEKEDVAEVEGFAMPILDFSVLDCSELYLMEENPWVVPKDTTAMTVEVLGVTMGDAEEKGKEKEKSPASEISDWYF